MTEAPHVKLDCQVEAASCPVCATGSLDSVLAITDVPAQIGTVWPTRREAVDAPSGSIVLTLCRTCGFVFNRAFSDAKLAYAPGYEISLHHSRTYQGYLDSEVARLVDEHGMRRRFVVEIGCGDGHFLRLLCTSGDNVGWGFDPALSKRSVEDAGMSSITLVNGAFDAALLEAEPDLVVCRSVLELISDPTKLVRQMRAALGHRGDALVYVEVPNAAWIFNGQNAWNVYYEHCSYFTAELLRHLFEQCSFETISCGPCYEGGQYLRLEARPSMTSRGDLQTDTHRLADAMHAWSRHYTQTVQRWHERFEGFRSERKRVAIWGAGGRGTSFASSLTARGDDRPDIAFAIDVNPLRQGMFMPGTGLAIRPPSALRSDPVDVVIITNATYENEILAQARALGVDCKFLLVDEGTIS
jgi:SAM-dependent methyltransferase